MKLLRFNFVNIDGNGDDVDFLVCVDEYIWENTSVTRKQIEDEITSYINIFEDWEYEDVIEYVLNSCLVELLLNGNKVKFGELGTFSISLQSEPADSMAEFSAKNIKEVNILFTPGEDFQNLRSKAEFNQVTSRAVQAASLKAIKEGENIVDLTALKKGNATDDPTDVPDNEEPENSPTPGGGGNTSGGGTDDNGELAG